MPNLILVHDHKKQALADFERVCELVRERAPDIATFIAPTRDTHWLLAQEAAGAPCFSVAPMPSRGFAPPRGPLLQGLELPKAEQYSLLREAGMPVPDWAVIEPGVSLNREDWGPYVVVKPDMGRCGRDIKVKKTSRVKYAAPKDGEDDDRMLAQAFVYTGPWASTYRVVTLFGQPLLCWHCEMDHEMSPLPGKFGFASHGGVNIVSNKRTSTYRAASDADVLELGARAHACFPERPLLGHDIARDADTGELFILECNPRGDTWLFSSWTGSMIQQEHDIDFYSQFDGLSLAADVLIRETRANAA